MTMPNAEALKQTVRKLVYDLLEQVPVPPTTSTAGKARAWLGSQGGVKPPAVNVWMRQALTEDSLYTGAPITLTTANALAYCADVDDKIDEFTGGAQPEDPIEAATYAYLTSTIGPTSPIPVETLEWMGGQVITTILVEI